MWVDDDCGLIPSSDDDNDEDGDFYVRSLSSECYRPALRDRRNGISHCDMNTLHSGRVLSFLSLMYIQVQRTNGTHSATHGYFPSSKSISNEAMLGKMPNALQAAAFRSRRINISVEFADVALILCSRSSLSSLRTFCSCSRSSSLWGQTLASTVRESSIDKVGRTSIFVFFCLFFKCHLKSVSHL